MNTTIAVEFNSIQEKFLSELQSNAKKFNGLLSKIDGLEIEEQWVSKDVRPGRAKEKWLNLILRRKV